jgi:hypothetical protein
MLAKQKWQIATIQVLENVFSERLRQHERYGDNAENYDGTGPETRWLRPYTNVPAKDIEADLRHEYVAFEEETGAPTWLHLVLEEFAEAAMEEDPTRLEEELTQVAALCVSWVEQIRLRGAKPMPVDER